MNTDYTHIEKIEAFINGQMPEDELANFKLALDKDEELQEQVDLHRDIQRVLLDKDSLELKKQLLDIADSFETKKAEEEQEIVEIKEPKQAKMPVSRYLYLSIAATIVLFISLVFVLRNNARSEKQLFQDYYAQYPATSTLRGESKASSLEEAMKLYDRGMYLQAIDAFQSEFAKDTSNHLILIYLGNCYLKTQKWNNASETLMQVPNNSRFVYDAYWFTALSNLREKQYEPAKELLNKLVKANSIYKKKASELLEELD